MTLINFPALLATSILATPVSGRERIIVASHERTSVACTKTTKGMA